MADNMAPLFAAVYSVVYEGLVTDNETFISKIKQWISSHEENSESDEEMIIKELLNSTIRVDGGIRSIGELIHSSANEETDSESSAELARYGIKYIKKNDELAIQYDHKNLRDVLKDSPYVSRYGEILKRHKFAKEKLRSVRIGVQNSKSVIFDYKQLSDEFFSDNSEQYNFDIETPEGAPF